MKAITDKYNAKKNPYTYRPGGKGRSYDNRGWTAWNKQNYLSKTREIANVTASKVKASGFVSASIKRSGRQPMPTHPTSRKLWTGEAINQVSASHLKNNTALSRISNKTTRYEVAISRANQAVYAGGSLATHALAVQNAKNAYDGKERQESLIINQKAQKKAVIDRANDNKKWNTVIAKGYEQSTPVLQKGTVSPVNWDNVSQKEYTKALRAGEVNLATALLKQRTPGGYKGPNTVNLESFLSERGYNINNPQSIPDSIFKPEKQMQARTQASKAEKNNTVMGDLRNKRNVYSKINTGPGNFFGNNITTPKFTASQNIEFLGPTDKRKIENFTLMGNRPLTLTGFVTNQYGLNTKTGKTERLKTVGETTSPEMQFFGQFVQGSRNTFDSYGNLLTNLGNTVTGKPQQPMSRPPVQDQFFGALIDSGKNTFYGKQDRSADPMGDFFGIQKKRIDTVGYGQVAGELTTEALFWALPIGSIAKVAKGGLGFFSTTVKTTKNSKAFTPGSDFMKFEGKTKDVSWSDQLGAFFGPKGPKGVAPVAKPFVGTNVGLGKGTTKGKSDKKSDSNNFFGGSSGGGKKSNFFDEPPKTTKTNNGLVLLTTQKPKLKPVSFFKSYPIQLGKTMPKVKTKIMPKVKQVQFFKSPKPKIRQQQKQILRQKPQQFFKPIPLITPKVKTKQIQKQILKQKPQQFFKQPPKQIPLITPKIKEKKKLQQVGVIAPYFPPSTKTTGMFLPPLPMWARQGGVRGRRSRGPRLARTSFTAWNVNPNQVGGFLKGPTYKKSRSDYIFKDLDKRTKKEKKKKDYDYLDFF